MTLLAHGVRPNRPANRARMVQYIAMFPPEEGDAEMREARIRSWREREAPSRKASPGYPRDWEKLKYETANLTAPGWRLLGLEP